MSDLIVKFYFTIRKRYLHISITKYNGTFSVISESRCSTCVFVVDVRYNGIERHVLIFPYIHQNYFVLSHCWEVGAEGGWPPPSNTSRPQKILSGKYYCIRTAVLVLTVPVRVQKVPRTPYCVQAIWATFRKTLVFNPIGLLDSSDKCR